MSVSPAAMVTSVSKSVVSTRGSPTNKYDKYTTAAATWPGRNWMHTVVSRLSLTKLVAACAGNHSRASEASTIRASRRGVRDWGVRRAETVEGMRA